SAGYHRAQLEAVAHALREALVVDQLAQGDLAHGRLVDAGPLHLAADAVELGPAVLLGAVAREPLRPAVQYERHANQRLHVVDDGRAVVEAGHRREGRLQARLPALALQRLDERRLLAALVGAGAGVHVDLEVVPGAQDVLAQEAGRPGLLDRHLQ